MRNLFAVSLFLILAISASARAQSPSIPSDSTVVDSPLTSGFNGSSPQSAIAELAIATDGPNARPWIWGVAEYQRWWIKNTSLPPLITTGNPSDPLPGAIGQPGTQVIFGGNQSYGALNGMRLSLGGWFQQSNLGWEVSGFLFQQGNFAFGTGSGPVSNPPLYVPIYRPDVGREGSITLSQPFDPVIGTGGLNGNISIASQSRLWGAETNLFFDLATTSRWQLHLLAGFRYLDLQESLIINTYRNDTVFDIQNNIHDSFSTRSQFYGGQIGVRAGTSLGRLSVDFTGKVALGETHQSVSIHGSDTVSGTGFGPTTTFNEGIFTQTSNIGRFTTNDFAVIPQLQLKLAYELRQWLSLTATYDWLYWSRVIRAGTQIDHSVDLTQSNGFNAGTPGATFPGVLMDRSGFWAQGASVGLLFQY